MAGLLPSDLLHHGAFEAGTFNASQDKSEDAGGRWYFSRKEIEENSPSRRDSIDLKKETYLRKSYCTFLQDLGMRLKVPQVTIATAIIFCHRFFLRQSHARNDRRTVATVCMFLAGKVEETPRPLRDVILVSYEIIHKKDSAAVQRIKQKEVYEQQKELLLLCEVVVLATLGFDLNVHHPYKPLVEAIKKFKVAQNALAQVAWNFVNDGLRTSLCLQFKPHHIAAGAIFLAAKFLKVKLPSDGEKVWWQEFDVTPRQLEEVSNQMLELYEQNRMPPQGSEAEGSAGGRQQPPTKIPADSEENVVCDTNPPSSGATLKVGSSKPVSSKPVGDADNHVGSVRDSQFRNNELRNSEVHSDIEMYGNQHHESTREMEYARLGSEGLGEEEQEKNAGRGTGDAGELRDKHHGRNIEHRDGAVGQSPQEVIKKIEDKVKAALEKRRKSRPDVSHRTDLDDDDLIESALENGIQLDERKQNSSKLSKRPEHESNYHMKPRDELGEGPHQSKKRSLSHGEDLDNVEEGEVEPFVDGDSGYQSPKYRKRRAGSPVEKHPTGPLSHGHHDLPEDRVRFPRTGYSEREHKRHAQENHA